MSKLGICIAILVALVGTASAQALGQTDPVGAPEVEIEDAPTADVAPAAPSAYDQCIAERQRISAQASSTTDLKERARTYQSMPECHREPTTASPPAAAPQTDATQATAPVDPDDIREIKSPGAALAWSLGTTLAGFVMMNAGSDNRTVLTAGAVLFVVGPTTGHIYAGEVWNAGLGLRLVGAGVGFIGLVDAFSNNSEGGAALAVGGSLLYIGATVYEIGTAPAAARDYNRKMAGYKLVPIASPNGGGVSLVGSF